MAISLPTANLFSALIAAFTLVCKCDCVTHQSL
jgi:hypothetical protein